MTTTGGEMTTVQLRRMCKLWQKRLRITDWTVTITWATPEEMPENFGETQYDPRNMIAKIRVREGGDDSYPDGGTEQTVIHELLHIVMHGDKEYRCERIMQERAINQIADALFWSHHKNKVTK